MLAAHCLNQMQAIQVNFNHKEGAFSCPVTKQYEYPTHIAAPDFSYDIGIVKIQCSDPRYKNVIPYLISTKRRVVKKTLIAGYGSISIERSYTFPNLNYIELPALDLKTTFNDPEMTANSIEFVKKFSIAAEEGKVACHSANITHTSWLGDSGGPTFFINKYNRPVLWGVTVVALGKGEGGHTLFASCSTNISYFYDWVKPLLEEKH